MYKNKVSQRHVVELIQDNRGVSNCSKIIDVKHFCFR